MFVIPVEDVKPTGIGKLWVRFADGVEGEADFSKLFVLPNFSYLDSEYWLGENDVCVHPWSKLISWDLESTMGPCDVRKIYDELVAGQKKDDGV